MVPRKPRDVSVRFTEMFLRDINAKGLAGNHELKLLAQTLAEDPTSGEVSAEIEHLRSLAWTRAKEQLHVWYLYYPESRHIEVVAVTRPDDKLADAGSMRRAAWWALRIGIALRAACRAYRFVEDHVLPHLDNVI